MNTAPSLQASGTSVSVRTKACRVHAFGPPTTIEFGDVDLPQPGVGEMLVRVMAAGVGPWDGWIRSGKSVLPQPLPLTLGSDLSGVVEAVGPEVTAFTAGDEVYGVTNKRFTGAYAEHAIVSADMMARKPASLDHIDAASVPVIAVTAWQALYREADLKAWPDGSGPRCGGQCGRVRGAARRSGRGTCDRHCQRIRRRVRP